MDEVKVESMLAVMDERGERMEKVLDKLFEAIYGNGEPGLKESVRAISGRLGIVENKEDTCPLRKMQPQIDELLRRHEGEDEEKKMAAAEMRKFRYTALAAILAFILDFVLRLIK